MSKLIPPINQEIMLKEFSIMVDASNLLPEEKKALEFYIDGMSEREAADRMKIAKTTARTKRQNAFKKLGLRLAQRYRFYKSL